MDFKPRVTEVDLHKVQMEAEQAFRDVFFCCEAVLETIIKNFDLDVPHELIRMSTPMAVGAGKSGCMCGAANGGIVALGLLFGRDEKRGPKDPEVVKCLGFSKELHDWFEANNGKKATCCRVLTREFNMAEGEHKKQCVYFTGLCAWKVAEIIAREFGIKTVNPEVTLKTREELYAA
ncbi:MAG: C_GCAxxG_C_C family protein [Lachnospiraceae bacterium]|nr:C_GCAxxG_C_C family protein [Lachnospiraceae bacterium]